ncbi:MAG TPA: DUF1598 domain-containing protein [Pirellulales bacterium]|nr:DUF1598 domain-containing protein [Pirellulales bacterium]
MSIRRAGFVRRKRLVASFASLLFLLAASSQAVQAQGLGGFFRQAVGGVFVDGFGVLHDVERDDFDELRQARLQQMQQVPGDLVGPVELRKVSLRQMQAAIIEAREAGKELPDEVRYLAGIQRIQYVFVYPEQSDIVLAGFGEGWQVDKHGNMLGKTTGRPVMELDDLIVALRSAESAAQGGISCSIDPTKEGLERMQAYMRRFVVGSTDAKSFARGLEQELGPQTVTFQGVPANTRFAAVLLTADYRMKRLAMAFEHSLVRGLTSYLHMLKGNAGAFQNVLPRWWLASDYEPMLTDGEGLAWELRGPGVKAMTEDEMVAADGTRQALGTANASAARWAKTFTEKYDELSAKEPIFGELRNCIDLAVIAALIVKENLAAKAGCDLSLLLDPSRTPLRSQLQIPRQVPTRASVVENRKDNNFVISASGGVLVNSWGAADDKEIADLSPLRAKAADGRVDRWWWN